jgi:nucleoside-diphosphate-sugar epimerase
MWPDTIADVAELEDLLSRPSSGVVSTLHELRGDIVVLGVGGKMGPSLARMARRASETAGVRRRVFGVSRFSAPDLPAQLESSGIEPVRADLADREVYARLPDAANVVFMAGMKFGTAGREATTWATNAYLPALVCERYRSSRIVAFSTGNVYGLSPVTRGGSREEDPLNPAGEYAMSCVARERLFEYFSRSAGARVALVRLNYATELRYGVLVDIAASVLAGQPVPLSMGHFNAIWQADASNMALQALARAASPPFTINVAGPDVLSVRGIAAQFGALFGRSVQFEGSEADNALLSDARRACDLFGRPEVDVRRLVGWIADWLRRGGVTFGKPTHFEERAGRF